MSINAKLALPRKVGKFLLSLLFLKLPIEFPAQQNAVEHAGAGRHQRTDALYALDFTDENEQNVCTEEHVAAANAKGWTVYCKTANGWQEYDGEGPTGINSIDNGKLIIDNWYSVDGKKLNGEPTKKGVYIMNGRKVLK